jgi:hypothetical protein
MGVDVTRMLYSDIDPVDAATRHSGGRSKVICRSDVVSLLLHKTHVALRRAPPHLRLHTLDLRGGSDVDVDVDSGCGGGCGNGGGVAAFRWLLSVYSKCGQGSPFASLMPRLRVLRVSGGDSGNDGFRDVIDESVASDHMHSHNAWPPPSVHSLKTLLPPSPPLPSRVQLRQHLLERTLDAFDLLESQAASADDGGDDDDTLVGASIDSTVMGGDDTGDDPLPLLNSAVTSGVDNSIDAAVMHGVDTFIDAAVTSGVDNSIDAAVMHGVDTSIDATVMHPDGGGCALFPQLFNVCGALQVLQLTGVALRDSALGKRRKAIYNHVTICARVVVANSALGKRREAMCNHFSALVCARLFVRASL